MEINILSSSSKGNAIRIGDGYTNLLLDCGLSYRKLSEDVNLNEIEACLVTHGHNDHCAAVKELLERGYDVWMSEGTSKEIKGIEQLVYPYNLCRHGQEFQAGSWKVMPFNTIHDCEEPLGYMLQSTMTGEKALYIVDSGFINYDFQGIHCYLIEANYEEELLENGPYDAYLKDRVRKNHFSLENLKTFLETSDLSRTEEIYLLHLSDSNSDEKMFVQEIQQLTGKPTYTAS